MSYGIYHADAALVFGLKWEDWSKIILSKSEAPFPSRVLIR